ncbi:hypothetical protein EWB00_000534, partial [Schistosoma japonicum]
MARSATVVSEMRTQAKSCLCHQDDWSQAFPIRGRTFRCASVDFSGFRGTSPPAVWPTPLRTVYKEVKLGWLLANSKMSFGGDEREKGKKRSCFLSAVIPKFFPAQTTQSGM